MSDVSAQPLQSVSEAMKPGRFDRLKIGTCLTSSWICMSGFMFYLNMNSSILQKFIMAGIISAAYAAPYLKEAVKLPGRTIVETFLVGGITDTPDDLARQNAEMSKKMGFAEPLKFTYYRQGISNNAFCMIDEIYYGKKVYKTLNYQQNKFVIGHEHAHAKRRDGITKYLIGAPYIFCAASPPLVIFKGILANQSGTPLAAAFSIAAGLGLSALTYQFTKMASRYVDRILEYRADRTSVETTKNPIAAISALSRLTGTILPRNIWQKLSPTHPSRDDRIAHIVEEFNAANAERAISIERITLNEGFAIAQTNGIRIHNGRDYDVQDEEDLQLEAEMEEREEKSWIKLPDIDPAKIRQAFRNITSLWKKKDEDRNRYYTALLVDAEKFDGKKYLALFRQIDALPANFVRPEQTPQEPSIA